MSAIEKPLSVVVILPPGHGSRMDSLKKYGGFHKYGGTPSHHPFRTMGFSITFLPSSELGDPPWRAGNPHMVKTHCRHPKFEASHHGILSPSSHAWIDHETSDPKNCQGFDSWRETSPIFRGLFFMVYILAIYKPFSWFPAMSAPFSGWFKV